MRKTVAKRIRKYISANVRTSMFKYGCRKMKRAWNTTPWDKRFKFRQELE